jgi:hypothetical protein
VIVHVNQLPGAEEQLPDPEVTLEASTDAGTSWAPVTLTELDEPLAGSIGATREGEKLYAGTINAAAGDLVGLSASVTADSSSFDQTVTDAYLVTDAPRGLPTESVSWNSCGVDPPPLTPSTAAPNNSAPEGTARKKDLLAITGPTGVMPTLILAMLLLATGTALALASRRRASR